MSEIPPYIRVSIVAKACAMPRKRARRMLDAAGITEQIGGLAMVGDSRLRERLPEVYERVFSYISLQAQNRPE